MTKIKEERNSGSFARVRIPKYFGYTSNYRVQTNLFGYRRVKWNCPLLIIKERMKDVISINS